MSETVRIADRRSQRIFHRMRLQALGRSHQGKKFREICETLVVNAMEASSGFSMRWITANY